MDELRTHYHYFSNEEGDGYEIYSCDFPDVKGFGETYEEAMSDLRRNLKRNEEKNMEAQSLMETAITAYDQKDYLKAKAIWESLSATNADAMVNLGTLYVKGFGVPKNIQTAYALFNRAAELGHESASFYLGGMYENGIGVVADKEQSIRYYTVAAEANMPTAQLKLGILLRNDDVLNSMKWMIRAAHAGEAQAHSLLTYVSNQNSANDINVAFRMMDEAHQYAKVEMVIRDNLAPILASDGGGVELVNYVSGDTPEIWLRYLGACSGCHLGPTSTAGMILEQFENVIDKKIVIYLW
ncbi:MAG: SEL1-like repeat protein [Sulfuricurvum sp.]|uniref:NifU family protein n=1 Tax=Sulfuricurvum sp. TaxID=2025608 RepID=UPI002600EBF5|nr:NifU family protein [Sulfuricurvum sp.]MBV5320980.1 SEL1-like repeat protein [Sulfuricurvum sp.]